MATAHEHFSGFEPAALRLLADLAKHNDRAWFAPRKERFATELLTPLALLVRDASSALERAKIPIGGSPQRCKFLLRERRSNETTRPVPLAPFALTSGRSGMIVQIDANTIRLNDGRCIRAPHKISSFEVEGDLIFVRSPTAELGRESTRVSNVNLTNVILYMETSGGRLGVSPDLRVLTLPSKKKVRFDRPLRMVVSYLDSFIVMVNVDEESIGNVSRVDSQGGLLWQAEGIPGAPSLSYIGIDTTEDSIFAYNGATAAELDPVNGKILSFHEHH